MDWFYHQDHSDPSAIWSAVGCLVLIFGPFSKVVNFYLDEPFFPGAFDDAFLKWPFKHFGKQRDNIYFHSFYFTPMRVLSIPKDCLLCPPVAILGKFLG